MRPLASLNLSLLLFAALYLPIFLASPCAAKADNKPTQFNNGQNGTPNLPESVCRFIDLTHMRGAANGEQHNVEQKLLRKLNFDSHFDQAVQNYLVALDTVARAKLAGDKATLALAVANLAVARVNLQAVVNPEFTAVQNDAAADYFPNSSFYVGSEVRAGAGKTVYILPALAYCDNRSGIELSTESFFEFGNSTSDVHDGLGVSLKGEFTDVARAFPRKVSRLRAALAENDNVGRDQNYHNLNPKHRSDLENLNCLVNLPDDPSGNDLDLLKEIAKRYKGIADADSTSRLRRLLLLSIDASGDAASNNPAQAEPLFAPILAKVSDTDQQTQDLLHDYVRLTKRAVVAGFVGNRFYNEGGGSLLDGGVTASQLFPFRGNGAPAGVTALVVAQGFDDRLQGGQRRGAERLGLAAIWQDRTPFYDAATRHLAAPWNVKFGLEYTTPLLGLHETYAEFVRCRLLPSYVEITVAAGKDGQRKDYVDVSIGKSVAF